MFAVAGINAVIAGHAVLRILAGVALLLLPGLYGPGEVSAAVEVGIVAVDDLSLRTGPGRAYRVIAHLPEGTQVRVLARKNGWLQVEHNGFEGFLANDRRYVRLTTVAEGVPRSVDQAQAPYQQDLKEIQAQAEAIGEQLKASQSELTVITAKERAVLDELNGTEQALNRLRREVKAAEAGLQKLEDQIQQLQKDHAALEKEIIANEVHAAGRLEALYKLSWIGRIQLLATADSFFDFIQRKSSLERILRQDESLLETLNRDQVAIESLMTRLTVSKAEKRSLEAALKESLHSLDTEQAKRNALLGKIRGEKNLAVAALSALQAAAEDLDAALRQFTPRTAAALSGGAADPQGSFERYKGLLSWPVRGKILSFFGPYRDQKYDVTNFQRGIDIQAERGEPIRAVADGHAIFANWFKGFGNMLIVDHGDHYYTVYAHLEEIFKVRGDRVEKGEVIATVGDSGSLKGPALHFEVRHRDKPLDPLEWFDKG